MTCLRERGLDRTEDGGQARAQHTGDHRGGTVRGRGRGGGGPTLSRLYTWLLTREITTPSDLQWRSERVAPKTIVLINNISGLNKLTLII